MESQTRNRNNVSCFSHSIRMATGLVALGVLQSGCERSPQPVESSPRSVVADVIVSVSNQTRRRMQIYLEAGVSEHVLGVLDARSSRSFSLPSGLGEAMSALQFEARERGAVTGFRSGVFSLSPGQQALWTFDEGGSRAVTTR